MAKRGAVRQWPFWAGYAASGWAVLFGAAMLVAGHGSLYGIGWLGWAVAAVLLVGAGLAAVSARGAHRGQAGSARSGRRLSAGVITVGLWGVVLVALAGSAFVLLDLISWAMNGAMLGRDGRSDWGPFAERLGFVAVAALFLLAALAWRRRTTHGCPRCGLGHPADAVVGIERPLAPAPPRVRLIAHLGSVAFVPYYACHLMRFADLPPFRGTRFADPGDPFIPVFILCTALPADFLLLGLVHSWGMVFPRWTVWLAGRRVPRFLPVVPVWLIAPTLAGYGTAMWIYLPISGPHSFPDYLLSCVAATAFAGYGWTLGIAAVSYQRRTRPRCVLRNRVRMSWPVP